MAKHTRKQFYELCGVAKDYLKTYIRRGKVIVGSDGYIDDTLPHNRDFMSTRAPSHLVPSEDVEYAPSPPAAPAKRSPARKQPMAAPRSTAGSNQKHQEHDQESAESIERYNLDRRIKEKELEKKEQEIEKNRLQIAKLKGDVIPTELVMVAFSQHFKSVTTAFHQGCDNFIMVIAKRTGMSRADMADMRGELIGIVNQSVTDGIKESKLSVGNIVGEYSEKRGRGERK